MLVVVEVIANDELLSGADDRGSDNNADTTEIATNADM